MTTTTMKPVSTREKTYNVLALLYRVYVLEEASVMGEEGVDNYLKEFGPTVPSIVYDVINRISNGDTPADSDLDAFGAEMLKQLKDNRVYW